MKICKTNQQIGYGSNKIAFSAKICEDEDSTNWTSTRDPKDLCIVEFKNEIQWITDDEKKYVEFKKKIKSDPKFDYSLHKFFSTNKKDSELMVFSTNKKDSDLLEKWYRNSNDQFDIVNELKKMHELNKIGITTTHSGAGAPPSETTPLAPMLYQIRIDTWEKGQVIKGIPFSPYNMDSEFSKIPNESIITISYLVERCGKSLSNIILDMNDSKISQIGKKIIEFIDAYVDLTNELNCDFKPNNLCPQYNSNNEIVSLSLLDIDAKFYIKNDDANFRNHAKVFMKFMVFSYFRKYNHVTFPDWGISKASVVKMFIFFYDDAYMLYKYNPINMLWNYFDGLNPTDDFEYQFMYYDDLKMRFPSAPELVKGFKYSISFIPEKRKGGSKKSRKYKKKTSIQSRKYIFHTK